MPQSDDPQVLRDIDSFLRHNLAAFCYRCIGRVAGVPNVQEILKPSRASAYSFSTCYCANCGDRNLCVAYVG